MSGIVVRCEIVFTCMTCSGKVDVPMDECPFCKEHPSEAEWKQHCQCACGRAWFCLPFKTYGSQELS